MMWGDIWLEIVSRYSRSAIRRLSYHMPEIIVGRMAGASIHTLWNYRWRNGRLELDF